MIKQIFFFRSIPATPVFFLPHQQIRSGSEHGDLKQQQKWKEHPEIPVLRLVVKKPHTHHTTQAAEASRRQEQRFLGNPPCASLRSSFIDAHKGERDEVHDDQDGQRPK